MTLDLTTSPVTPDLVGPFPPAAGTVYLPGDAGYDTARSSWNLAVDQRPAAVALPTNAREVSAVVLAAARLGLRVAPQSTGHNAGPLAAQGLDDVVLVSMQRMRRVTVDVERRIARAESGAIWMDAMEAATPHGLVPLHGSSPDVGITGYSLGGGIGWYARKLGMATNSLTAVEIVTADGNLVRADATHNVQLFWAVRGGGGNFGVVTALEFKLYPIETAYAGMLLWDATDAEPVLRRWAEWTRTAPDEVTTSFRLLNLPPLPDLPPFLQGRSVVVIDGAVLGTDEEAEAILRDLRELGPEMDTFARVPAASLIRLHMDPEGPTPGVGDSTMLGELTDETIDAFLAAVGPGSGTTLLASELRHLGGALARPAEGAGVLPTLDGAYVAFGVAVAMTPEAAVQGQADATGLMAALSPWANGRNYLNFAETAIDARTAYREEAWVQLTGIRSAYDPDGRFVANHRIPRLYEDGRPTASAGAHS